MTPTRLLAVLIPVSLAPAGLLAQSPTDVLRLSRESEKSVSYRGMKTVTVYYSGRFATSTLKIIHLKPDKTRTEYFSPAAIAGVILIEDGPNSWKYCPKEEAWEPTHYRCGRQTALMRHEAFENYEIKLVGTDEVAGRQSFVIYAAPKRRGEWAHRLWIDRDCYLLMGTQTENASGSVVNSSRFTSVDINPDDISPSVFRVTGTVKPGPKLAKCPDFKAARPAYLPKGYRLVETAWLTVKGLSFAHTQFSDGANVVSLFQRTADGELPPVPVRSNVTNVLTWARRGMRFTLMGDLPRAELRKIADSVP